MTFNVKVENQEDKVQFIQWLESVGQNKSLCMPKIYGFTFSTDSDVVEIKFDDSDSTKVFKMLKDKGYKPE